MVEPKKRGPKDTAALRLELAAMTKERDDFRGQLLRRETDYENHQRAQHTTEVQKLLSTKHDRDEKQGGEMGERI